ncbi:MAG: OmpH family outer membrane protein [Candidatus Baltobacteraceae bacterium]
MKIRLPLLLAAVLLAVWLAPGAIAADLTDVGYIDQADVANLPVFVSANRQLAAFKASLDAQFSSQSKHMKTDADRQRVALALQQQLNDKQREIIGPIFQRAQLAIGAVSASRGLSIVVDKRVVIFGGQDITKDVEALFLSPQAIAAPTATPPPASIGYVDQNALDGMPKVQTANNAMQQFVAGQRQLFSAKMAVAKSDSEKQQILQQYNQTISSKQDQLLKPLVDQTKNATAAIARKKNLLLVIDRADVILGGMDITTDVQNELNK